MRTLDELRKLSLHDLMVEANKFTDAELEELRTEAASMLPVSIIPYGTYREKAKSPKYPGTDKCFVAGCDNMAEFEGGDARFWCGMCEEHASIRFDYVFDLIHGADSIRGSLPNVRTFRHPPTKGTLNDRT